MKSTFGWLVDASGTFVPASRYRFGAVPEGKSPRDCVPTYFDVEVAGAALPGLWGAVVAGYAGMVSSAWWLVAVPFCLIGSVLGIAGLGVMRSRAIARSMRLTHRFTTSACLIEANGYLQAAAEALDLAPSKSGTKLWRTMDHACVKLEPVGHFVDRVDSDLAHWQYLARIGELTHDQYTALAIDPWNRSLGPREQVSKFTQDTRHMAITDQARANVSAMRTGAPRYVAAPQVVDPPTGPLADLFS